MEKKRNSTIDIMRLFFAIGVVMGHSYFLYDINHEVGYWISRVIPRMSVPFFFCISGYFYIKALMKGINNWKAQVVKIISIYAFWSVIYYAFGILLAIKNHTLSTSFFLEKLRMFVFDGSYYHFWYFVALIYTIIIVGITYQLVGMKGIKVLVVFSIIFYLIAFMGTEYCGIGAKIPVLCNLYKLKYYTTIRGILAMGLPFFMLGYFLNAFQKKIEEMSNVTALIMFIAFYGCYLFEAWFARHTTGYGPASEDLAVAFFMMPALFALFVNLLKHPMPEFYNASVICRKTSNFMYYIHPLLLQIITTACEILSIGIFMKIDYGYIEGYTSITFIPVLIITLAGGIILSRFKSKFTSFFV